MSWTRPELLWLLLLLPAFTLLFFRGERAAGGRIQRLIASRLQRELLASVSIWRRRLRFLLLLLALGLCVAAAAGPRWGYTMRQIRTTGRDVTFAFDVSRSMLAADLRPNRLVRAKLLGEDLIGALAGERIGVVAFAGSAFLQAPLTVDQTAVLRAIRALDTRIIPRGGTNIAEAIRLSLEAFGKGESASRILILMTDGEELAADAVAAAKKAAEQGVRIFTIGIGTPEGAVIQAPLEDGRTDFVRDERGNIVKSQLDAERLREIARAGNGEFYMLSGDAFRIVQKIQNEVGTMAKEEGETQESRVPIERFQYPLGLALLLLIIAMLLRESKKSTWHGRPAVATQRRAHDVRAPATVAGILMLCAAAAEEPAQLYAAGNYEKAFQRYQEQLEENPNSPRLHYNAGTAAAAAGQHEKAIENFGGALGEAEPQLRADASYNLAGALYEKARQLDQPKRAIEIMEEALDHLETTLELEPKNARAKTNQQRIREAIELLKKQQEEQEQQQEQQQQQQQGGGESKDQQEQQPQEQQQESGAGEEERQQEQQQQTGGGDQQQEQEQQDRQGSQQDQPQDSQPSEGGEGTEKETETPIEPERDLEGELEMADAQEQQQSQPENETRQQAALAEEQTQEEGLSEQQARYLLQSLQGEERAVELFGDERKRQQPVLRDW